MPNLSPGQLSEGTVVLAAGFLMTAVVGGSLAWHSWVTPAGEAIGAAPAPSGSEAAGLEQEVSALQLRLAEARTELAEARDAAEQARQRVFEAQAQAELDVERERDRTKRLEEENRRLKLDMQALEIRTRGLEDRVALLSQAASDVASGRSPAEVASGGPVPSGPAAEVWSGRIRIEDANQSLDYVVLTAGREAGIRNGMLFTVLEGEQPIADLRADDVRDGFTGAEVERVYPGARFPRPDDRVVLRTRID